MTTRETQRKAIALFRQHGGTLRIAEALRLGIHPRTLYSMRDTSVLVRLSRDLYRLAEFPPLSNPDLVTVALNIPQQAPLGQRESGCSKLCCTQQFEIKKGPTGL